MSTKFKPIVSRSQLVTAYVLDDLLSADNLAERLSYVPTSEGIQSVANQLAEERIVKRHDKSFELEKSNLLRGHSLTRWVARAIHVVNLRDGQARLSWFACDVLGNSRLFASVLEAFKHRIEQLKKDQPELLRNVDAFLYTSGSASHFAKVAEVLTGIPSYSYPSAIEFVGNGMRVVGVDVLLTGGSWFTEMRDSIQKRGATLDGLWLCVYNDMAAYELEGKKELDDILQGKASNPLVFSLFRVSDLSDAAQRKPEIEYISSEAGIQQLSDLAGQWVIIEGREVLFGSASLDELSTYVDETNQEDPFVYFVPKLDQRNIMVIK